MNAPGSVTNRSVEPLRCIIEAADGVRDGLALLNENPHEDAFAWQHPATDRAIVALGCVAEVRACGASRFEQARRASQRILGEIQVEYADGPVGDGATAASARRPETPLLVGGFGFFDGDPPGPWQDFPSLRFVLPRYAWVRDGDRAYTVRVEAFEPPHTPRISSAPQARNHQRGGTAVDEPAGDWLRRTAVAIERIRSGDLRKIVLARSRSVGLSDRFSPVDAVARLCTERPSCATFLVRSGASAFLGSSPEMLARVDDGRFQTAALAGSQPRGKTAQEDLRFAENLLACAKNAREHSIVVDELRAKLAPVCSDLHVAPRPEVRRLPESFHLFTPFSGRLTADRNLFDVAGALHPTAAVCGIPSPVTMHDLARNEPGRGWYAGACGWIDAYGSGELTVALRSALVERGRAVVWAGAGIVDGSCPESELAEVENKMTALTGALESGTPEAGGA